jgi:protein SCO1/2
MSRGKLFMLCVVIGVTTWTTAETQRHFDQGIVVDIDSKTLSVVISCQAIPGYMEAMEMPFKVRSSTVLKKLKVGTPVHFIMVEDGSEFSAERIEKLNTNGESEPIEAARLDFVYRTLNPDADAKSIQLGQLVPDFALMDQEHRSVHLSQFKGKVVALTFAYSRCPNPNYCFRLTNNLAQLRNRFPGKLADDLRMITIVIDPANDQGAALQKYAQTWKADPSQWYFLTGPIDRIRGVGELFGMNFWNDDGFWTHPFHTVVIDRNGRLAANVEGNQFTAKQLGDLVQRAARTDAAP